MIMAPFDEMFVLLIVSIFFSLIYELGQPRDEYVWSGIVSSICWLIFGLVWLIKSDVYVVSLLFSGLFLFYTARWMIELIDFRRVGRRLGED